MADIVEQLGPNLEVQRGSLARASLSLQNVTLSSQSERNGIVYTLTVPDSKRLARWLRFQGIDGEPYYGALETDEREILENRLLNNEIKALVATVRLGWVSISPTWGSSSTIWHSAHGEEDDAIAEYFIRSAFPAPQEVDQLLAAMRSGNGPLTISNLQKKVNLPRGKIQRILLFLLLESPAPIQKTASGYVLNPVRWQVPIERMKGVTSLRRRELERMQVYMGSRDCLMQFLAEELNDRNAVSLR